MAGKTAARSTRTIPRRAAPPRRLPLPSAEAVLVAFAVLVGVIAVLTAVSLALPGGWVTGYLRFAAVALFGKAALIGPAWLLCGVLCTLLAHYRPQASLPLGRIAGAGATSLSLLGLLHVWGAASLSGGFVGFALAAGLVDLVGQAGTVFLLVVALVAGLMVALDIGPLLAGTVLLAVVTLGLRAIRWFVRTAVTALLLLRRPAAKLAQVRPAARRLRQTLRPTRIEPDVPMAIPVSPTPAPQPATESSISRPSRTAGGWRLPPSSLFQASGPAELTPADTKLRARVIEETLQSFGLEAKVVEVNHGPAVTQFGLEPAPGVAVNRILARANDLALRLGATPIRMEAPVPGKRVVGLEVPNVTVTAVNIRGILESPEFERIKSRLRLALGRDVVGNPAAADLARMPHLLIAGATGSGKSVCINSIIASLLVQCSPDELQFVMVDPKMVELAPFAGIPHLRMPVVTEMERVVGALKWVVKEMERRYSACAERRVRNLESYNKSLQPGERPLPHLVVVIDELADMMMTAADEVERTLCRLAQLGRAAGIHLVVATQRPSVDVITGLIKANFPTRISFAVSSQVDSRTILDMAGAEKLLGRGDMLFMATDSSKPRRLQGAYVSDQEIQQLVDYWTRLGRPTYTEDEVKEVEALGKGESESELDDLYQRGLEVATQYQRISTSLLQRRLGIGYPRAARLIDLMEERGAIGPAEDGKSREVLVGRE